ncbi:SCO4225 family membrane protein [Actinomadura nitritigenes]|uniref:SCO4225 family membrane protein n=1 Tax=Actinomadura nitritigenes TaxID=134602 RepID=UPI003D949CAE
MFSSSARASRSPRPARGAAYRVRLAVAVGYAAAVTVATGIVLAADLFADDPGFIGVFLILATAPLSMVSLYLLDFGEMPQALANILFYVATTGSGVLQTWLLWPGRLRRRTAEKAPSA